MDDKELKYLASYFLNGHVSLPDNRFDKVWEYSSEKDEDVILRHTKELFKRAMKALIDECEKTSPIVQRSERLAVLLSGGVDSSYLLSMLVKHHPRDFDTYTLRYVCNTDPAPAKNTDCEYALRLSEELGLRHYQIELNGKEALDNIEDIISLFDLPYAGSCSHYFALKALPKDVYYVFTGDGADELFMGYPLHITAMNEEGMTPMELLGRRFCCPPALLTELIADVDVYNAMGLGNYIDRLSEEFEEDKPLISVFDNYLYRDALPNQVLRAIGQFSEHFEKKIMTPYLDEKLIEYVRHIDPAIRLQGAETKHLLKTLAKKILPEEYINRRKEMFVPPVTLWLMDEWKEAVTDVLGFEHLSGNSILDAGGVYYLLKDFYSDPLMKMRTGEIIWNLFMFQKWWENNA